MPRGAAFLIGLELEARAGPAPECMDDRGVALVEAAVREPSGEHAPLATLYSQGRALRERL